MDITTLATAATTALLPFLKEGGNAIAKGVGGDLWTFVKSKFAAKNKDKTLDDWHANPEDAKQQGKVEAVLEDVLTENPDLITQLQELIAKANAGHIETHTNTANVTGDNNTVIQGVHNSQININK